MVPRTYSTPRIFFFQIGLPNQIAKRSIFSPRQRAARKCPNSCTKMSKLNRRRTSKKMKKNFKIDIIQQNQTVNVDFSSIYQLKPRWQSSENAKNGPVNDPFFCFSPDRCMMLSKCDSGARKMGETSQIPPVFGSFF